MRKVFFWLHLIAGCAGGLVILSMCVTGVLIAFEPQLTAAAERDMRTVTPQGTPLGASEVLAPNRKGATALTLYSDPTAAAMIARGREGVTFVDPYSGKVTGQGAKGVRAFFRTSTDLHRWLALKGEGRDTGRAITGACNAAFLFLALSGLYLWWPRHWTKRHFQSVMTFRRRLVGRARDYNWHNVIGFWCSPVLIVLTTTGVVMSYSHSNGPRPPAQQGPARDAVPRNLDALVARAQQQVPGWTALTVRFGGKPSAVSFQIMKGDARSQLTLDAKTAEVTEWKPGASAPINRALHTGTIAGFAGQLIAAIASLGGAFLVWTGISLALRRLVAWKRKRSAIRDQPGEDERRVA